MRRPLTWSLFFCLGPLSTAHSEAPRCGPKEQFSWSALETSGQGPSWRSSPAVVALDDALWVFGGVYDDFRNAHNEFYDDLYRLDLVSGRWLSLNTSQAPAARAFAAAAAEPEQGNMLLFGGSQYEADFSVIRMFGDVWSFDPYTEAWSELQPRNAGPSPRASAAVWVHEGQLYVFGGIEESFALRNDLWALDLRTLAWREVIADGQDGSPAPRRLAQVSALRRRHRITLYGGEGLSEQSGDFETLNDSWELDLDAASWTEITPAQGHNLTPARNDGAATSCGRYLYLVGGDMPFGQAGCGSPFAQQVTNEIWRFDPLRRSFRLLEPTTPPLPALKRTGYATWNGRLYLVSGWGFRCEEAGDPGQIWNSEVIAVDIDCDTP